VGGLYDFTFLVNFLGVIFSLWLGIYLVTRNARFGASWLTALTLWGISGFFLNMLLAINPPPPGIVWPNWMRILFVFWPTQALNGDSNSWLMGWTVIPALAFWNHRSSQMVPGKPRLIRKFRILFGYACACLAVVVQHFDQGILTVSTTGNPLYLQSLVAGPWYPYLAPSLVLLPIFIVYDQIRARAAHPGAITRKQLWILAGATLGAGLSFVVTTLSVFFQINIPMVTLSVVVVIPVGVIGYGVARYSASMEGRALWRDFRYNLMLLGMLVLVFLLGSWIMVQVFLAPRVILVFLPVLAVITYSLVNQAYRLFDPLFYRSNARQLRSDLRLLMRHASDDTQIEDHIQEALQTLCTFAEASYGLFFAFEGERISEIAAYRFKVGLGALKRTDLEADDVISLAPGHFAHPLEEAALLIPLYSQSDQIGALLLGRPLNGVRYAPEDIEDLLDRADQLAVMIYISQLKSNYMKQVIELSETRSLPGYQVATRTIPIEEVETALRNLNDYAFLGDSALAGLNIVKMRLPPGEVTHLERGKVVQSILMETLEKLCPQRTSPHDPPPREWHPYLVLHEAYCEEKPKRDIMLQLYISEGTFNRTRRSAIHSIARVLSEMELALT
jgi:hypothetical protein